MPQLNYIGTILTSDRDTLVEIEQMMERFVTSGFQIAKSRLYVPANSGGIGEKSQQNFCYTPYGRCINEKRLNNSYNAIII